MWCYSVTDKAISKAQKIFTEPGIIISLCVRFTLNLQALYRKIIVQRCPNVMCGYCKLLRTDMKRNVKIIRNQNEQLLLFLTLECLVATKSHTYLNKCVTFLLPPGIKGLSVREGHVYWERVNARERKFFKHMWNVGSLCGAASLIKCSIESQIRGSQNVRTIYL